MQNERVCLVNQPVSAVDFDGFDVDSGASITCTPHRSAFRADTLTPVSNKYVQVATGGRAQATHVGTISVVVKDKTGVWRRFEQEGAWLVPELSMSLLSCRRCKELGWRAPDFNTMTLDLTEHCFPIVDRDRRYVLDACLPETHVAAAARTDAAEGEVAGGIVVDLETGAAVAIARGRKTISLAHLSPAEAARVYHSALGHVSAEAMRGIVDAAPDLSEADRLKIKAGLASLDCDTCLRANAQRKPAPTANIADTKGVGDVAADLKGPLTECRVGPFAGAQYAAGFKDLGAKLIGVYFLARKSGAVASVRRFLSDMRALQPDYRLRSLRTDRGGELVNHEMDALCAKEGTRHELAPPYQPNMTLFEPNWRSIGRMMRAGLSESKLDFGFWPYFALQAVSVLNCFDRGDGKSALELLTGRPARAVAALRPIGCRAFVLKTERELLQAGSSSVAERAWAGINLGLAPDSPAYLIYVPELGKVRSSTNVDFKVAEFPMVAAAATRGDEPADTSPGQAGGDPALVFDPPPVDDTESTEDISATDRSESEEPVDFEDHGYSGSGSLGGSSARSSPGGAGGSGYDSGGTESDSSGSGIGRAPSDVSQVTDSSDEDYVGADLVHRRTESPELRPADVLQQPFEVAPDGQAQLEEWMRRRDRAAAAVALLTDEGVRDYVDVSALCGEAPGAAIVLHIGDRVVLATPVGCHGMSR